MANYRPRQEDGARLLIGPAHRAAIGKHFGVHYATVSRAVKDFEKIERE